MKFSTEQKLTADVLVAGGGLAGVCAALAAARNGARTILAHDRPVLGGNASSEVRMHICGADCHGSRGKELELEAREGGIIEELRLREAVENPQRCPQMMDLILYDMCRRERNLQLLLNASAVEVKSKKAKGKGRRITRCSVVRPCSEERFESGAQVFVDCTGDGKLGAEAGAEFRVGREARREYGESLAPARADRRTLGSSLLFTARKHNRPLPFVAPAWARKLGKEFFAHRPIHSYEYGFWWIEWGGELDTIRDNERIRDELAAVVLGVWDYIKNSGAHPNSANWALDWIGWLPGKRESRRFVGQHVLTQNDLLPQAGAPRHWDDVAYGGWAIDIHPPSGIERPELPPFTATRVPQLYGIPLRCLVSRNVSNLLFAGRNMSATHVAFASTRVMATCAVLGQAAGTAAALAVEQGGAPGVLCQDAAFVKVVQQRLLRDDCYIPGAANADERDLARKAQVSASSYRCERSRPEEVVSGVTRVECYGAPARRLHRWISSPERPLSSEPAWIKLKWERPQWLDEVRVVFDTGLHRQVTLSQAEETARKSSRGPQPECVKAYRLLAEDATGRTVELAAEGNNVQRLRVHRFQRHKVQSVTLQVLAAQGVQVARVAEIRCYDGR